MKIIDLKTKDTFWDKYKELVKDEVIPYQWKALNDELENAEPSHAIRNFKIAAGLESGEYYGEVFQDSDVAKWIETVAYSLKDFPDSELENRVDEVISIIEKAQEEDGYFNTFYMLKEPTKKWNNLRDNHELYCGGHFIEAAVAYYQTTKKDQLINVVSKFVDLVDSKFGLETGKIKGIPGHQEIELALLRLYDITNNPRHLELAKYFIYQRGQLPNYFEIEKENRDESDVLIWNDENNLNFGLGREYQQDHLPVMEQKEAVGHAVRAVYYYTSMADLAHKEKNEELFEVTDTLWEDVTQKKMYVTGGIGASANGESFSVAYDLPNDTMYCETCASVGMTFWANRMNQHHKHSKYHDILEREIYNGTISGMNLDGNRFLYVNPLEVNKVQATRADQEHVLPERQAWFKTACCPPNLARMIASVDRNIYDIEEKSIYFNQYIGSDMTVDYEGNSINIEQKSDFPWKGNVDLIITAENNVELDLYFRMPNWCDSLEVALNGQKIEIVVEPNGYLKISKEWANDTVSLIFNMPVMEVISHPEVKNNIGKIALQRGPIVYCIEEADNSKNLAAIYVSSDEYQVEFEEHLLNGVVTLTTNGEKLEWRENKNGYTFDKGRVTAEEIIIKAIPYFAWNNRTAGEMLVWINKK